MAINLNGFSNLQQQKSLTETVKAYQEGVYSDSPANRKLGRVGMTYKQYEESKSGASTKKEETKFDANKIVKDYTTSEEINFLKKEQENLTKQLETASKSDKPYIEESIKRGKEVLDKLESKKEEPKPSNKIEPLTETSIQTTFGKTWNVKPSKVVKGGFIISNKISDYEKIYFKMYINDENKIDIQKMEHNGAFLEEKSDFSTFSSLSAAKTYITSLHTAAKKADKESRDNASYNQWHGENNQY